MDGVIEFTIRINGNKTGHEVGVAKCHHIISLAIKDINLVYYNLLASLQAMWNIPGYLHEYADDMMTRPFQLQWKLLSVKLIMVTLKQW